MHDAQDEVRAKVRPRRHIPPFTRVRRRIHRSSCRYAVGPEAWYLEANEAKTCLDWSVNGWKACRVCKPEEVL